MTRLEGVKGLAFALIAGAAGCAGGSSLLHPARTLPAGDVRLDRVNGSALPVGDSANPQGERVREVVHWGRPEGELTLGLLVGASETAPAIEVVEQSFRPEVLLGARWFVRPPSLAPNVIGRSDRALTRATVPLQPVIDMGDYQALSVPTVEASVKDEEIENAIDELRRRYGTIEPVDRPAQKGDIIRGNLKAEADGEVLYEQDEMEFRATEENLASLPGLLEAIEGMTKGETRAVESPVAADFANPSLAGKTVELREIDRLRVAGRGEAERVFEVMGRKGEVDATALELRERYAEGLAAYRSGRWQEARAAFVACLALRPDDRPAAVFLERLDSFAATPPGETWNGVWPIAAE